MRSHYRAVVIGGGVVGASVLYHLTRFGWPDVALLERSELTAGSTWHAAAGCHALNANPNIAALQGYTIRLYKEIEEESGQDVGLRMCGGITIAASPERWAFLKAEKSLFDTLDMEARLVGPEEIAAMLPIIEPKGIVGGLYDPHEGHLDPHGTTHAYAGAARKRGADVVTRNRVVELRARAGGGFDVVTEQGTIAAEHVINAGGLWARRVGRMLGVDLPVTPMQHHYLVTEDVPEIAALPHEIPAVTDMDGFTYLQQEKKGVLLGVYERNPAHWAVEGAPWDYGMDLLPPDVDRIAAELEVGFERFPALKRVGIKRWVNGAFTFTPDGNPLVGPVPGVPGFWAACGCMAGFSQGGAIGLALARWMIEGDPGADVLGMDVARYPSLAANDAYLRATTRQFYARRFAMTYPNEELPAGRPCKTSPCHDELAARGARFSVSWGLETPAYFAPGQPDFVEKPTLTRSNAHALVAAEHLAVREAAGLFDTSVYARYEVAGPGAEAWLDRLLACRLPMPGRMRLAPMLKPNGQLMGDLIVARLADDRFWLTGSYYLQAWHLRWLAEQMPPSGVRLDNLSDRVTGFAISGPRSREILARLTGADLSAAALPLFAVRETEIGFSRALLARLSLTGELGFEVNVPAAEQRSLYRGLMDAGRDFGLRDIGNRALDTLRLEKSYGIWSTEYTQAATPGSSGLDHHVAFEKPGFIGRDAALRERDRGPRERLVTLEVDAGDADARGFEPVFQAGRRVGYVTSGAYGHFLGKSLAMAYVETGVAREGLPLGVDIVGERRQARIIPRSPYDPEGTRIRA